MKKIVQTILFILLVFNSSSTWAQETKDSIDFIFEGITEAEHLDLWSDWYKNVDRYNPIPWDNRQTKACDDAYQVLDKPSAQRWCLELRLNFSRDILNNGFPVRAFSNFESIKQELEALDQNKPLTQSFILLWNIEYASAHYYHYEEKDSVLVYFQKSKDLELNVQDPFLSYKLWKEWIIMLLKEKEIPLAFEYLKKATLIADTIELKEEEKWTLQYFNAMTEDKLGNFKKSEDLYLDLLTNLQSIDTLLATKIKLGYADVMCRSGQTQKALKYFEETLPEVKSRDNIDVFRKYGETCAACYMSIGENRKGSDSFWEYQFKMYDFNNKERNLADKEARKELENNKEVIHLRELEQTQIAERNQFRFKLAGIIGVLLFGLSILGYFLFRNYLKRKDLKSKIERDQKIAENRDQLFSAITHDIRTPLALMMAPLERAEKSMQHPQAIADLQLAQRSGMRLMELFNQILDWNKTEAKAMAINPQASDLSFTLYTFCDRFIDQAKEKGITFISEIEIPNNQFILDYDKLDKILSNLVSNAIKFCKQGDEVILTAKWQNEKVEVQLKDTGPGISKEDQANLFDRHFQGEQGKLKGGTGIGLALVKELVDLMRGNISLESELGKGSVFTVLIPATSVSGITEETIYKSEEKASVFTGTKKAMILIVEDEPDLLSFLQSALQKDYEVKIANNTTVGLSIAQSQIPDLIISDWSLPDHDGGWLCQKIKSIELTAHIPVLILTAFSSDKNLKEVFDSGAIARMNKPFKLENLDRQVKSILDQQNRFRNQWQQRGPGTLDLQKEETPIDPFLEKVMDTITNNLSDEYFNVEKMAADLYLSRTQLFRKVKNTTNFSPSELLNIERLKTAQQLLKTTEQSIADIAFSVGFSNQQYFSTAYKKHFDRTPSMDR